MPLLLVGMLRPGPQRDDLLALRPAVGDGARMQLAGLDQAAVTDLVTTLAGGQPDDGLPRLADGAAGKPAVRDRARRRAGPQFQPDRHRGGHRGAG